MNMRKSKTVRAWLSWFSGMQAIVLAAICVVIFLVRFATEGQQGDSSPRASSVAYMGYLYVIWFGGVLSGFLFCLLSFVGGWIYQYRQEMNAGFPLFWRSLGASALFVFVMVFTELIF